MTGAIERSPLNSEILLQTHSWYRRWKTLCPQCFFSPWSGTHALFLSERPTPAGLRGTSPSCLPFSTRRQQIFYFILVPYERVPEKAVPVWWCAQRPRFSSSWSWRTWDLGSRLWICCRTRSDWPLSSTRGFLKSGQMASLVSHKSGSVERINHYVLFVAQHLYVAEQEMAIMNNR